MVSRESKRLVEIVGSTHPDPQGMMTMVRLLLSDKSRWPEIAEAAAGLANGVSAEVKNNYLSILRSCMARVCKEIGIQKLTVKEQGNRYIVCASRAHLHTGDAADIRDTLEHIAKEARYLSLDYRIQLLSRIRTVLGLDDHTL